VLHLDRLSPEDRERIQHELDAMLAAHGPGGLPELDAAKAAALTPPRLKAGRMPPMVEREARVDERAAAAAKAKAAKKEAKAPKTGFGGGGGGAKAKPKAKKGKKR
jgi:hypothetical protein